MGDKRSFSVNFEHLNALRECGAELNVLFVEDDAAIRELYGSFLRRFFKSVVLAEDGKDALEKFEAEAFALVITDIAMPRMNGIDMAKAVLQIRPDQCIIFVTAYNDDDIVGRVRALNPCRLVHKPFSLEDMVEMLYELLAGRKFGAPTPEDGGS